MAPATAKEGSLGWDYIRRIEDGGGKAVGDHTRASVPECTGVPAMGHRSLERFAASRHAAVIPNEVSLAISNIALRSGKETAETMLFFVLAVPKSKDSS